MDDVQNRHSLKLITKTMENKCFLCTEFELTVELLPVPAKRVDASNEFSTGRLHASIDHGALS